MQAQDASRFVGLIVFYTPRDFLTWARERDIGFVPLEGCNGIDIRLVYAVNRKFFNELASAGFLTDHPVFLYLSPQAPYTDGKRSAFAVELTNGTQSAYVTPLGQWVNVSKIEADDKFQVWTRDPATGQYWVCDLRDNLSHDAAIPLPVEVIAQNRNG